MKFLNTPVEEKLFKKLKILAIKKDTTIEKVISEAIKDILKKYDEEE
jgi:hypothetical protein